MKNLKKYLCPQLTFIPCADVIMASEPVDPGEDGGYTPDKDWNT